MTFTHDRQQEDMSSTGALTQGFTSRLAQPLQEDIFHLMYTFHAQWDSECNWPCTAHERLSHLHPSVPSSPQLRAQTDF